MAYSRLPFSVRNLCNRGQSVPAPVCELKLRTDYHASPGTVGSYLHKSKLRLAQWMGSGPFALETHRLNCKEHLTKFLKWLSWNRSCGVPIDVGLQSARVRADGL